MVRQCTEAKSRRRKPIIPEIIPIIEAGDLMIIRVEIEIVKRSHVSDVKEKGILPQNVVQS